MKVEAIDIGGLYGRACGSAERESILRLRYFLAEAYTSCKVCRDLRFSLVRQLARTDQSAVGQQNIITIRMEQCSDGYGARLFPIELEGRKEVYIFDRFYSPARKQRKHRFRKRLDSHDPGQYRNSIDAVVKKKWLSCWVQRDLDSHAAV